MNKRKLSALILLSLFLIGIATIVTVEIQKTPELDTEIIPESERIGKYLWSVEFNSTGNIVSYTYDKPMAKLIYDTRFMTPQEKVDFLFESTEYYLETKESTKEIDDQSMALLYVDTPQLLIDKFGNNMFRELQIIEYIYRIEIGQTPEELDELTKLQAEQFGFNATEIEN